MNWVSNLIFFVRLYSKYLAFLVGVIVSPDFYLIKFKCLNDNKIGSLIEENILVVKITYIYTLYIM